VEVLYTVHPVRDLSHAPHLAWVQMHSAGVDYLIGTPLWQSSIPITTLSGVHATTIGEYVLTMMLALAYRVPRLLSYQHQAEWPHDRWTLFARRELRGQTVGIVGYGSIGREVARLAVSFGMRVLAMKRSPDPADHGWWLPGTGDPDGRLPERFFRPEQVCEMLAESDFVVLALPMAPATEGFIGQAELRAMKPTACLINIARGPVIDEAALVRALREGWIAGAGLDVFEHEPLPADSPLWQLDNVILSPHVAGFTVNYDRWAVKLFADNLGRYLAGQPLLNLVDRERGY
jgi:phosphoglycerate dehydrogenase-like enzyme